MPNVLVGIEGRVSLLRRLEEWLRKRCRYASLGPKAMVTTGVMVKEDRQPNTTTMIRGRTSCQSKLECTHSSVYTSVASIRLTFPKCQ